MSIETRKSACRCAPRRTSHLPARPITNLSMADGKPRPGPELQQEWATNDSRTLQGELATLTHTSVHSGQDRRTPAPLCDVLCFCGKQMNRELEEEEESRGRSALGRGCSVRGQIYSPAIRSHAARLGVTLPEYRASGFRAPTTCAPGKETGRHGPRVADRHASGSKSPTLASHARFPPFRDSAPRFLHFRFTHPDGVLFV
jgi:hypothetical protein